MTANTKKTIIACAVLIVAVAVMGILYFATRPETKAGQKAITIEISAGDGSQETLTITTEQEYLGSALVDYGFIEGEVSEFGMFISSVRGITADPAKEEWWCLTKGGEDIYTGVDSTPIEDGDAFELTLMKGF